MPLRFARRAFRLPGSAGRGRGHVVRAAAAECDRRDQDNGSDEPEEWVHACLPGHTALGRWTREATSPVGLRQSLELACRRTSSIIFVNPKSMILRTLSFVTNLPVARVRARPSMAPLALSYEENP